jgi:hypothetical protein
MSEPKRPRNSEEKKDKYPNYVYHIPFCMKPEDMSARGYYGTTKFEMNTSTKSPSVPQKEREKGENGRVDGLARHQEY